MSPGRKNLYTASAAALVLVAIAALSAGLVGERNADVVHPRPSTYFTDPSGARGLFLVMERLLPEVSVWRRPLSVLPLPAEASAPATLIVAGPSRPLARAEADQLDAWLAAGGQLILASHDGWPATMRLGEALAPTRSSKRESSFLGQHGLMVSAGARAEAAVHTVSSPQVTTGPLRLYWAKSASVAGGDEALLAEGNVTFAAVRHVGRGRIVAIADPAFVSNQALMRADNAVWLVRLAAAWGSGRVAFDEYHHGFGERRSLATLTAAFLATPWGVAGVQLAAAGALYVFGWRRRFGRAVPPPLRPRRSPLDLISGRASFFDQCRAQALAVELMRDRLVHALGGAYGQAVDLESYARRLGAGTVAANDRALQRLLQLDRKARAGTLLEASEFIDYGRLAAELIKEVAGER